MAGARGAAFPPTTAAPRVGTAQPDESPQNRTRNTTAMRDSTDARRAKRQNRPGLGTVQPSAGTAVVMGPEPGHPHAALPCRAGHPRSIRHPSHPCLLFCWCCTVGASRVLQLRVTFRPARLEMTTNQSEQARQSDREVQKKSVRCRLRLTFYNKLPLRQQPFAALFVYICRSKRRSQLS